MSLENFLAKNNKFPSPMAMLLIFFMNKIKCLFPPQQQQEQQEKAPRFIILTLEEE